MPERSERVLGTSVAIPLHHLFHFIPYVRFSRTPFPPHNYQRNPACEERRNDVLSACRLTDRFEIEHGIKGGTAEE